MIPRYSRPGMVGVWTEPRRYDLWLRVELAACEAAGTVGVIPAAEAAKAAQALGEVRFDEAAAARIGEIERTTRHDVIAFLTYLEERFGEATRYLHYGLTSSDILDTALALQLCEAADLLLEGVDAVLVALETRAKEHRDTPMMGRSHGIHAEPITFGLVLAVYYAEMRRQRERLAAARGEIAVGKLSGAVGTFAHLPPAVEERALAALGLAPEPAATQVVQRDRHAAFFQVLALIGATAEKIAVEIRHLQRTEVGEVEEAFHKGQKGSSAMPHKRNPVLSENLTGGARLLRGYALSALENMALWHERDISHSSVERVIAPDATILLDFMLHRLAGLIANLVVYPENMRRNLGLQKGRVFSQPVLLKLADRGCKRQDAYAIVQRNAMKSYETGAGFLDLLLQDQELRSHLSEAEIRECFDLQYQLRHTGAIFTRVFRGPMGTARGNKE